MIKKCKQSGTIFFVPRYIDDNVLPRGNDRELNIEIETDVVYYIGLEDEHIDVVEDTDDKDIEVEVPQRYY